ncbi:hypothetical protein PFICI_04564 [Pestalotiopsis fici W106-1]|uniref:Carboxylic ester hydrolase n=1 Tax=Pestalotiopsis fici (strain W106-1 / CGMCC3.15140) TaxID=1229662 RepID=W3X992_PESFW|nr:uncharacterized protein PFICI_04564 [Pestalotiopsis fici W106-1]ETS82688.1 hypothetical protein PFICI_04564 [Pestalotiopsis fici W106-1]
MQMIYYSFLLGAIGALGATLADFCTQDHVQESLPQGVLPGVTFDAASITANAVSNQTVTGGSNFPGGTISYCNVTFQYAHANLDETIILMYWLPDPAEFQGRFLATGGGGLAISSGSSYLPGGILYGATAGTTDGGYGGFQSSLDNVVLAGNGSLQWNYITLHGYQAIHEMTVIGKSFTGNFYDYNDKIYTYYQGCSEGGREGWSQAQKFGAEYDGIIAGAPAFHYAQLQTTHIFPSVAEQTLDYYPPPCELSTITSGIVTACDPLDGKADGVIARSDLCRLDFNISTLLGTPYYCNATSTRPVQDGTVSAQALELVDIIMAGLHNSKGELVWVQHEPGAGFSDATTTYDQTTGTWKYSIPAIGGDYVTRFIQQVELSNLPNLDNVTYDTLSGWIIESMYTYMSTLQTTYPDLTDLQQGGGKIIHYHGEQDGSIATGSSVIYREAVRQVMFPGLSYNESNSKLDEFYRFYLIPGAGHCGPNTAQPNGPFPQTVIQTIIDWVENAIAPETLNGTVLQGQNQGQNQQICAWPLRPFWQDGSTLACEYDQTSIDSWTTAADLNAYKTAFY